DTEQSVRVVEFDAKSEMLFDDVFNWNRCCDFNATPACEVRKQRRRIALNLLLGKVRYFGHLFGHPHLHRQTVDRLTRPSPFVLAWPTGRYLRRSCPLWSARAPLTPPGDV